MCFPTTSEYHFISRVILITKFYALPCGNGAPRPQVLLCLLQGRDASCCLSLLMLLYQLYHYAVV